MSDTGNSSPRAPNSLVSGRITAGVVQKSARTKTSAQHPRARHRGTPAKVYKI